MNEERFRNFDFSPSVVAVLYEFKTSSLREARIVRKMMLSGWQKNAIVWKRVAGITRSPSIVTSNFVSSYASLDRHSFSRYGGCYGQLVEEPCAPSTFIE